jgi:hypothetical protein
MDASSEGRLLVPWHRTLGGQARGSHYAKDGFRHSRRNIVTDHWGTLM